MGRLRRLLALIVVGLGGLWGILFCLANDSGIALDLVVLRLPDAPLAVWVLGAFVLGGLCGLLASGLAMWRARIALLAARRGNG